MAEKDVTPNFKKPKQEKTGLTRKTPLRFRSKKTAELYRKHRVPLVKEMLEEFPLCQVGPKFKEVAPSYDKCTLIATCLHELKKRSAGGDVLDRDNILTSCIECNESVENLPLLAYEAGLVIKAWEH